jgi:hypothetical protein
MIYLGYFIGSLLEPISWVILLICAVIVKNKAQNYQYIGCFVIPTFLTLLIQPAESQKAELVTIFIAMLIKGLIALLILKKISKN